MALTKIVQPQAVGSRADNISAHQLGDDVWIHDLSLGFGDNGFASIKAYTNNALERGIARGVWIRRLLCKTHGHLLNGCAANAESLVDVVALNLCAVDIGDEEFVL